MPTPKNQTYKNWAKIVDNIRLESEDIVIGWSTGAIFAVRYLYENKIKVKKFISISGFNNYIGSVPEVDNINKDFFMKDLSVAKNVAEEIICFKSDNDPFITQSALNDFASNLCGRVTEIKNGGHFNTEGGFVTFRELVEQI